ncbi:hypothetical protein [Clostridium yunnanense]|nr:hypothetical protein [Clostridium yunnanense]
MRKLSMSTIRKMLLKFIIVSFVLWAFNVLFTYLTKGELILNDKILLPIACSFGLTFGEMVFFKKNEY